MRANTKLKSAVISFLTIGILLGFLASFLNVQAAATLPFSEGFETNNFTRWNGTSLNTNGNLTTITTYPHHGTYNMNSTIAASASEQLAACSLGSFANAYSTLYMRAYVRWNRNPTVNPNVLPFMGFWQDVGANSIARAGIGNNGTAQWTVRYRNATAFANAFGSSTPVINTVYCVELKIVMSSTVGAVQLWVNGVSEISLTGLNNADRNLNYAYFGWNSFISTEAAAEIVQGDCFVLSTTAIGAEDMTAPTYSAVASNSTTANTACNFSVTLADTVALANYTFGTNNTGTWANDTVVSISGTTYYANVTKTLNATVGIVVQWEYWFADAMNNLANTGVLSNTTISGDSTKPTYSNIATNSTVQGAIANFTCLWTDNINMSGYIFGTNNTGAWTNKTWTSAWSNWPTSTSAWANVTKTLNATVGVVVQYTWWANDTVNNWNDTGVQSLTVTTWGSGTLEISTDSGSSWTPTTDSDMQFEIWAYSGCENFVEGWNNFTTTNADDDRTLGEVNASLNYDAINWTVITVDYLNGTQWSMIKNTSYNSEKIVAADVTMWIYCLDITAEWSRTYE